MRIERIRAANHPPLREVDISCRADVVIIAGANGSGKTRLKDAIVATLKAPGSPTIHLELRSTRKEEVRRWGSDSLIIDSGKPNKSLTEYMKSRVSGGEFVGNVIQVQSDRSIQPVKFDPLNLSTPDPDDTEFRYTHYLDGFSNRWQNLVKHLHAKAANWDLNIAHYVKEHPDEAGSQVLAMHPDPLLTYKEMFASLLPNKTLCSIDPKKPGDFHYQIGDSKPMTFGTLSSGEREMVRILFDLMWKNIRHCAILIDEPELHLHPIFAFRLIETIKKLGDATNQLILFTHSADLISTYYSAGNVYYLDPKAVDGNQARPLNQLGEHHANTARAISTNLGVFAVGKKLLFVEGVDAGADRLVYHSVALSAFPDLAVVPIGSVRNISALRDVVNELANQVFGIELYLLRDRDGLTGEQVEALQQNPRFRCLKRRHVENYFLDSEALAETAKALYLGDEKSNPANIAAALQATATKCLNTGILLTVKDYIQFNGGLVTPVIKGSNEKEYATIKKEVVAQVQCALNSQSTQFSTPELERYMDRIQTKLSVSLKSDEWKTILPGKLIFAEFCGTFLGIDANRMREAYVDIAIKHRPTVFQDIVDILHHFRDL